MDCDCLIHPFQNDPGTSQSQRVMESLLSGAAKIDSRSLADLLNYFVQMSRHINYYDLQLNRKDWQPFFKNTPPFTLASIINFPLENTETNFTLYKSGFDKKPSATGLQLIVFSTYYRFINSINEWDKTLKDSGLPIAATLEGLIKNRLQAPVRHFIMYSNAAVKNFGISRIEFTGLYNNPVWELDMSSLTAIDTSFSSGTVSSNKQLRNLYGRINTLLTVFIDAVRVLADASEKNLEASFIPLKEDLQKKHPPHLALLFAFLNMFRQLQNDLNKYTRKHLDYFYKEILQFKAEDAIPDRANIIFEIQKALKNYLIKKGIKVKGGKDENKQEILFYLDDDIVVNQATIADKRTLFLNNQNAHAQTYVEGVYIAPKAEMADGVEKEFEDDPKNFPTLGAHYSKYADPETKFVKPYPNARIGFILASPVLSLQTGSTRHIHIDLPCTLIDSICGTYFLRASRIFQYVHNNINRRYVYISEERLKQAVQKGFTQEFIAKIRNEFLSVKTTVKPCYCDTLQFRHERSVYWFRWNNFISPLITDPVQRKILDEIFPKQKILNLSFSGEKGWVIPEADDYTVRIGPLGGGNVFNISIDTSLSPEKDSITDYNKDILGEDYGTTQPLVRVQLNDKIKANWEITTDPEAEETESGCCQQTDRCCLLKESPDSKNVISFYHFFRNIKINQVDNSIPVIQVEVCGLKNFIVQNDESVMDVNGTIYPFGARPDIVDFNVKDGFIKYYITRQTISDVHTDGISSAGESKLNNLIIGIGRFPLRGTITEVESFLLAIPMTVSDVNKVIARLSTKNYSSKNLIGPNFIIGSKEIFYKKWTELFVNLNWKNKPDNFREYYQAYIFQGDGNVPQHTIFGLDDQEFQINLSVLEDGNWKSELLHPNPSPAPPYAEETTITNPVTGTNNRRLFPKLSTPSFCTGNSIFQQSIHCTNDNFPIVSATDSDSTPLTRYDVNSRKGFLKINLQNQDFLHNDYAYVLARQMNAAAMLAILDKDNHPIKVEDAVYYDKETESLVVFNSNEFKNLLTESKQIASSVRADINDPNKIGPLANAAGNNNPIPAGDANTIRRILNPPSIPEPFNLNLTGDVVELDNKIGEIDKLINSDNNFQAIIPKEPWTPIISSVSLDYRATGTMSDIALIQLYPYDNTFKHEEVELQPSLFPTFCDEGTLFLGLKDLVPGENLNVLFQMAEATSDSESDKEFVYWHYLDSNIWKPLRTGFEVLDDGTKNLTSTGIIKFSLPANMSKDNTVMPKDLHWIKATIPKNSGSVSETFGIIPQAVQVIFTPGAENDKLRLSLPLAEKISKLDEADAAVKSVTQPYDSFGGLVPEIEQQFYVRVSETLRHKGRAIQAFDYERLVLQAFPQLFKVKCINHSFALNAHEYSNDFPYAGGYVLLAVIPDLNQLLAGNSYEPKVPVSIIEDINAFIRKRTSPFARFRAMNPRYEKINFCLTIRLMKGKDENYFMEKAKDDIRNFLAPWAVGDYYKLTFGQCVYRSDIIQLLETGDYVDYINDLRMGREDEDPNSSYSKICPATPRSILIAGSIEVCIYQPPCENDEKYYDCGKHEVMPCAPKPEIISDYCKKQIKKQING